MIELDGTSDVPRDPSEHFGAEFQPMTQRVLDSTAEVTGSVDPAAFFAPLGAEAPAPSFPKKEARLWKPEGSEFLLDGDFAQLIMELGETDPGVVEFDIQPEEQDGQPGHTLIASHIPNVL